VRVRYRARALLVALAACLVVAPPAWATATTCAADYSYAGFADAGGAHGVRAELTPLSRPGVAWGHVAGWVGVGGPGMGPNGEDAWIQVGYSGFFGSGNRLYYEVARPGRAPRYSEVLATVAPGETHRVAVLEMADRHEHWRVWVDGVPASEPVYLPGSHGTWTPIATAESWNAGKRACNRFSYRFKRVMVARAAGGGWRALSPGHVFEDPGYRVRMEPSGFLARAR